LVARIRALDKDSHLDPLPCRERGRFCHSERSEESRIFLDANHCTLNHGSTAAKAGGSKISASANPGFFAALQNDTERFARITKIRNGREFLPLSLQGRGSR